MPASIATVDRLRKTFSKASRPALDEISAEIPAGTITGLVGPDGAGKTTLIRILAGLLLPSAGRVRVLDVDLSSPERRVETASFPVGRLPSRGVSAEQPKGTSQPLAFLARSHFRDHLGYMPQKFGLYEDLTVLENLNLHADLRGLLGSDRKAAFNRLLDFTGLAPFTSRLAGLLSGGMKQKLGLACALLGKPKLLLLDEPGVGVDPISRRELWKMVQQLVSENISVLWSTAYLEEAEWCEHVLLLNEGRLLFAGKPAGMTERVRGRCFQLRGVTKNSRQALATALRRPEVLDGVIQGHSVRIVLRKQVSAPDPAALAGNETAQLVEVKPRFEDAFIDMLARAPAIESPLASRFQTVRGGADTVVEAAGLTRKFGNFTAADDISFQVKRGEIFGLLGPNGAGKSTTFRMMCGLLTPTSGTARVMGIDLKQSPSRARQCLGYMAQKFSLYGNLTVRQNLRFFSGAYGLSGVRQAQAIRDMVEVFALEALLDQSADTLPLGYKQRLALACALMHQPDILFLDEPTSGVDPLSRREFWSHINELVRKKVTVIVTTHFMEEAEYCDRIALIFRGRIIAAGTPEELKATAATPAQPDPSMEDAFISLVLQETSLPS